MFAAEFRANAMKTQCRLALVLFGFSPLSVWATTHYVALDSPNATPPYTNWATAATNIQDAVDATVVGDEVLVTNGTYATGNRVVYGWMTYRVYVDKPLALRSVDGPRATVIDGGSAVGCVYLTNGATLFGFTLTNGVADYGGVYCRSASVVLSNCVLTGNSAQWGGGVYGGTLNNCTLTGNSAAYGGGALYCTLNNCTLTRNSADYGGGAYGSRLNNCTLTGNSASDGGGGASSCRLNNCIVYFNSVPDGGNYDPSSTLNYCCTTPQPTNGVGNIGADPQLASASHLSAGSPCIGAGSATYASGTDIDGDAWANPPSIGCDEYHAGTVTGPLTVSLRATFTNVATGFPVGLTALIEGRTDLSVWDFGDGCVEVNEPYASHTWTAAGYYLVALWAFNDSDPGGVSATVTVRVLDHPVQYVALESTNPIVPYLSWGTAATNIQDAVDAWIEGSLVLVSNGVYQTGVTVTKPVTMQSVGGPDVTAINGGGMAECAYLASDALLVGFTLTNGAAENGGGVSCESTSAVLSNCVLSGNLASQYGGGACGGTLNNCTLTGNSAFYGGGAAESCALNNCVVSGNTGGGADGSKLNNCTVTGNSGWGASSATLNNCIVYFNSGPDGGNYDPSSTLNYCCTTPIPSNGVGNISADPQLASASHLSAESPCIGAGSATYASGTDIDGDAWANPPSIGCDEYHAGTVTGPLTVSLTATLTDVAIGYPVGLTAFIEGRTDLSVWEFGDGLVEVNEPYTSHIWTVTGDYLVALWAFNDSYPEGVNVTLTIHVEEGLHYVAASSGNPVAPYTSWATAARNIQDAVDVAPPGATIFVTNGTYAAGGRATPATADGMTNRVAVDKPLTVCSVNGPGVTAIQGNGYRCVYLTNAATLVGFTLTNGGWADFGSGVYCDSSAVLSNCVLSGNSAKAGGGSAGGTLNNCVLSGNSAYDWGGGGSAGSTLNNCVLSGNSAWSAGGAYGGILNNCTLTGNSAVAVAGGVLGGTLNNCTLSGNSAYQGGGASGGTLNNCVLSGNSAGFGGGGADGSTLNNCTLNGNSAPTGGGANSCTLNNCIVYYNSDNCPYSTLNYCCTTPDPGGVGNITNAPLFVDQANGNLRLQSNSPCINSGNNAYAVGSTDLDGNPRIVGGTVDIGAYEYQTPVSMISYAWLQQYGLPINTNTDSADLDGSGMNLYQDWVAGLNPTNALSVLQMTSATATNNAAGLVVSWESVSGIMYFLQSSTNLAGQPAFTTIQSNIAGQAGTTSYTDTTATNAGPYFYRVGVGN